EEILPEVIIGYRKVVSERYQFERISEQYHIPDSFTEERIARYRNYFLTYIYPPPEVRDELNVAFKSLDNFILHPEKVLRVLMDSTLVLLKHGRHIPKILKTSIKAFQSFKIATAFENQLVKTAMAEKLQPPFKTEDIHTMIRGLSRKEIDRFIDMNRSMLETLYDRKLMKEITEIVEHIVRNMKRHASSYSVAEIAGLEIGLSMIKEGNTLFDQLSKADQRQIFNLIISMEVDTLEGIFSGE
ncbi:MAG: hypothetical protein JKX84_10135, partial [Flavobacteriales bacterium]|nr:hypothetical protein [Flavobacteriales bacterium]